MLQHSFVLDALDASGADTFSHFEVLIEEHRVMMADENAQPSRLKQLVPTIGVFHTPLPLRAAFHFVGRKESSVRYRRERQAGRQRAGRGRGGRLS